MSKHKTSTPPGDYPVGYKRPPPAKRGEVKNPWGRKGKPRPAAAAREKVEVLRDQFTKKQRVQSAGRRLDMTAWEVILRRVVKDILKPERQPGEREREVLARKRRAMTQLIKCAEDNGWLDEGDSGQKGGFLVVYRPCETTEEFTAKFGGDRLPKNPLEGIPGVQEALLRHERVKRPYDDDEI